MMGKFQLFPDQASTFAYRVDPLFLYISAVTVFFTLLIFVLVLTFGIKYRRRHEDERPAEVHPPLILEIIWIVVPLFLVAIMFGWGAVLYVYSSQAPADSMVINVVGKQWMWKVQHPEGQREINEMHVPIGKPVRLIMTSQDVIHDFAIPAFRIKMDVVPERYTSEWFEATKPGEYHLFCDQYCGTQHSGMVGRIVVMEPDKYQEWLAGTSGNESPATAGSKLFVKYSCMNCHSQQAPTMANLFGSKVNVYENGVLKTITADEWYIRDSIVNPSHQIVEGYQPLMPSFAGQLSEEQLMDLDRVHQDVGQAGRPCGRKQDAEPVSGSRTGPTPFGPRRTSCSSDKLTTDLRA